jgi:hypothetical protein
VLAALGVWTAGRALACWRSAPALFRTVPARLLAPGAALLGLLLVWGFLGAVAQDVARRQRSRILDHIRNAAANARSAPQAVTSGKLFSVRSEPRSAELAFGYLVELHATRPASLLCVHVRGSSVHDGFIAYYTRHPIEPGANRYFFFNLVSGEDLGDARPYTAYLRTVGPAQLVSIRRLDLSRWPLGLPLSLEFDADDRGTARTMMGTAGTAIELLPAPSEVGHLLEDPGAFLSLYQPLDLNGHAAR